MRYVRVGWAKSVQDMDGELIKVNKNLHNSKRVNVVFDILHIGGNSSITLLRVGKVLAMDHDTSALGRGIRLFKSSPHNPRCCGGRDKLH